MLYSYRECVEQFGTDYKIKKAIEAGKLFLKERGIYSDELYVSELRIISKKYPNAIFTLNSAFYYHGLTDTIPNRYYLATPKNTAQIRDPRVKQIYENSEAIELGKTTLDYDGTIINIYDRERCLVELLRNRSKIPFDLYKEIIASYRKIIEDLDVALISDYTYMLPKSQMVMEMLRLEVL